MKKILLLLLFFCNSLYSQSFSHYQTSSSQLDFFKLNPNELLDGDGNNIINYNITDSLILNGEAISNNFGLTVSYAGDVNGDGFSDVIVGAEGYANFTGRVYIFYGGSSMDNIADVIITGEATDNYFGYSLSTAGDVNRDGYSDVIVGAWKNSSRTGRAYIYFGGSLMNNVPDVILTGEATLNYFGMSVSTAGDVNGDGYSDVIVGAEGYTNFKGRAYIFYGGSSMNNVADVILTGEATGDYFGFSLSTAGDVNGDGYSDVIILAIRKYPGVDRVCIYYGGSPMNTVADVTMTGETTNADFGYSLSTAGDINGDGYSDVIVGDYAFNSGTGRTYIYFGGMSMDSVADVILNGESLDYRFGESVSCARDINGDGFSDVIVGAEGFAGSTGRAYIYYGGALMNNVADIIKNGESTENFFGESVSSAGDVNGDGCPDVIVGAFGYNSSTGRAYLYIKLIQNPELVYPISNSFNNPTIMNFRWRILYNAVKYILNISTDSLFNNIIVNDTLINDTNKIVSGLQRSSKYYWRVQAEDTSGTIFNSSIWNFSTIPPLYTNIKVLFEGMYSPVFNQLTRKDTVKVYLRNSSPPYALIDSAKGTIDSLTFSGLFSFINASSGSYFLIVKHFNNIETWSKSGELLFSDGFIYNYDFTTANTQAYWSNLILKGSKYCLYSGDVNQDGFITLFDLIPIYNDASNFVSGRYLATDLTGDNIVDLTDLTLCYNNSANFIRVRRP